MRNSLPVHNHAYLAQALGDVVLTMARNVFVREDGWRRNSGAPTYCVYVSGWILIDHGVVLAHNWED